MVLTANAHRYATHLLEDGYDIRTVQELLGHGDVTTIYAHVLTRRVRRPESARSARAWCRPSVKPLSRDARRRIRVYRVLRISPRSHRPFKPQVTMVVVPPHKLNPAVRRATLQRALAYWFIEFGRLFVRQPQLAYQH